jgi:Zn-finger protein
VSYKSWFENHAQKHKKIIEKLDNFSDDEIIKYFQYDNMVKKEIDFCPLYKDNKKCHDIDDLNCYLCGCSNFRLTNTKSYCNVDSKDGGTIKGKDGFIHQNCSDCTIPHKENFIKKVFNKDWKIMMKDVL